MKPYKIKSPYENVIWTGEGAWHAYKGNLHAHTTYSDAEEPLNTTVLEYYNQGYDFLAISDHGVTGVEWNREPKRLALYRVYQPILGNKVAHLTDAEFEDIKSGTYPLNNGEKRGRKMTCVVGANELNNHSLTKNHVNGYFLSSDVGNGFGGIENEAGYERAVEFIDKNGGLSHINHPGDWIGSNACPDAVNDPKNIELFGELILKYGSCLGIEVFNERNGTTGYDRILWDNLLMYCLPYGKTVIGFSNTDSHFKSTVDSSFGMFMMKENDSENIKSAMQNGTFFAVTRKLRPNSSIGPKKEMDAINSNVPYPIFSSLTVDGHMITARGSNADVIQWIADGKVISKTKIDCKQFEQELDLDCVAGADSFKYVRAELFGEGGICLSQALVIDAGDKPKAFLKNSDSTEAVKNRLRATKIYAIAGEIAKKRKR